MWKECYRLGVDEIDRQHMGLFDMTAGLIETIKKPDISRRKEECKEAILFLKKYSLEHFSCEEDYQKSIQYSGFTAHRQMHQEFVSNVLMHESKMVSSDFDIADIESFVGMLTAWLAYHVADADQKIIKDNHPHKIVVDCFCAATRHSLGKMANISKKDIVKSSGPDNFKDDIVISVALAGDISAVVEYAFSNKFALELLKSFLFMSPKSMDRLVHSILLEVINTISKNAVLELARANVSCNLEAPVMRVKPFPSLATESFALHTPIGNIKLGVHPAQRS